MIHNKSVVMCNSFVETDPFIDELKALKRRTELIWNILNVFTVTLILAE